MSGSDTTPPGIIRSDVLGSTNPPESKGMHHMDPIFAPTLPFFQSNGHVAQSARTASCWRRSARAERAVVLSAPSANRSSGTVVMTQ
jgi:hypothetical protein